MPPSLAPGARVVVRDAEWLVQKVDRASRGGQALSCVGLSELVRGRSALFLSDLEESLAVLDPTKTSFVADETTSFRASRLFVESMLRMTPPTGNELYVGHRAAMDLVPYQLDPALRALEQPRQRILIADGTGLGKTLEAGILLSELIRRGRGRRILVVAVKSMLTQFQKEMWSRFTIPLVRLDSVGIRRIRQHIPTNHNPFHFYDRAIVSVDTLKQDSEYRTFLENAYWDVIVIDEAHNVAQRGSSVDSNSLRSRLARLLAQRSDTLIMLSATPHDGRARSFASLMNMLDPTAIANPDSYSRDDIKGLFIRRFKKDIESQVAEAFRERRVKLLDAVATPEEEHAFDLLHRLRLGQLENTRERGILFRVVLEKELFSSPDACMQTLAKRRQRLESEGGRDAEVRALTELHDAVARITLDRFSRFNALVECLTNSPDKDFRWKPKATEDRLVVFTESIPTLNFLQKHLPTALGLQPDQVATLHGGMSDVDQQGVVEQFGQDDKPVRLLIASDVASEGINLHFICHRMVHFDVPWSLMTVQQRNGRIDRYGQTREPRILYLITRAQHEKVRGDARILQVLVEKAEQAETNIGDPASLLGLYDAEQEEQRVAQAIEEGETEDQFARLLSGGDALFERLLAGAQPVSTSTRSTHAMPTLFASDADFLRESLDQIRTREELEYSVDKHNGILELNAPPDLAERLRFIPPEALPDRNTLRLSDDRTLIAREIKRSRKEEQAWPTVQYLWELNPVVAWAVDRSAALFGRSEAPVVEVPQLTHGEVVILVSGLIPNRKGHPLVHRWFGVRFLAGRFQGVDGLPELLERTDLHRVRPANRKASIDTSALSALLPTAVDQALKTMSAARDEFNARIEPRLREKLAALDRLRRRKFEQLEMDFQKSRLSAEGRDSTKRSVADDFERYQDWIRDTMQTEDRPYVQVVAALVGKV